MAKDRFTKGLPSENGLYLYGLAPDPGTVIVIRITMRKDEPYVGSTPLRGYLSNTDWYVFMGPLTRKELDAQLAKYH